MVSFYDVVAKFLRPQYTRIIVIIMLMIFGYFAYYGYNRYYVGKYMETFDMSNKVSRENAVAIYFFHADWCPHCKKAQPAWEQFVASFDGQEVNGYTVQCVDVDCTTETPDIKLKLEQFSVESFPTVKMVKDGNTIEFESKITETTLEKFVDSIL
jgi:thiol-disulfide isomerase/thioredoxin